MATVRDWFKGIDRGIMAQEDTDGNGVLLRFTTREVLLAAADHLDLFATSQAQLLVRTKRDSVKRVSCNSLADLTHTVECYLKSGGDGYNGRMWTSVLKRENLDPEKLLKNDEATLAIVSSWFEEPPVQPKRSQNTQEAEAMPA